MNTAAVGETISTRFEEPILPDGLKEHQGDIKIIEITPDMRTGYWFESIDPTIPVYSGHDDASDSRFVILFSTIYHKVEPEPTDQLLFQKSFALKSIAEENLITHAQMVGLMDLFDEIGSSDDTVCIKHDEMEIAWVEVDQYSLGRLRD